MSARIWLIRHGETEWSRSGRHTGRTDLPLTESGQAAAREARERVSALDPALVLCSPLARARQTAELAGLVPDSLDDDLQEWDYGAWEGLTTAQIRAELDDPAWVVWDHAVPPAPGPAGTPGEQLAEVGARVERVIKRCEPVLADGGDCVLVAHGHVLRILTATWLALPPIAGRLFALDPARLSALGYEHEQHVIVEWNAP